MKERVNKEALREKRYSSLSVIVVVVMATCCPYISYAP